MSRDPIELGPTSLDRIKAALVNARRELIDTTRRNRLLHSTRSGKRPHCLEIIDAEPDEVFNELTRARIQFGFASATGEERDEQASANASRPARIRKLQTKSAHDALQRRLTKFFRESRTIEEEQGINILFLALGFLHWFEDDRAQEACSAPLILIPVSLERRQGETFVMKSRDDDLIANISLAEKLRTFGIALPELPDVEDWLPSTYFQAVSSATVGQRRWTVETTGIGLGFFTFSKFLMWRDLNPETWPDARALVASPLVARLLGEEQTGEMTPPLVPEDEPIDHQIDIAAAIHVLDADSSQAICIEETRHSRNLVIQGPPGTGKSQTIANIIATAVHERKSVLFIAEKAAALDVVGSRLRAVGLEVLCLELHSRKATKQSVISSLERALQTGGIIPGDTLTSDHLRNARDRLNEWSTALHKAIRQTGKTPYVVIGTLLKQHRQLTPLLEPRLNVAVNWTREDFQERDRAVDRAAVAVARLTTKPIMHPWFATSAARLSPFDRDRLNRATQEALKKTAELDALGREAMELLRCSHDISAASLKACGASLLRLAAAPEGRQLLNNSLWQGERQRIAELARQGALWVENEGKLVNQIHEAAFNLDSRAIRQSIAAYGRSVNRFFVRKYRDAIAELRSVCRNDPPKQLAERLALLDSLITAQTARRLLEQERDFGQSALRRFWKGRNTSWSIVNALSTWADDAQQDTHADLLSLAAAVDPSHCGALAKRLGQAIEAFSAAFATVLDLIRADLRTLFGSVKSEEISIAKISAHLEKWSMAIGEFNDWVVAREALDSLQNLELGSIAQALMEGRIEPNQARAATELLVAEALWACAREDNPALDRMDGIERSETVLRFQELDRRRIELSRVEVLARYVEQKPNGFAGEMGVIRAETAKKRRHLPIRKLIEQAGSAVQRLKPVFLMSPLSVAQFLPVGRIQFDLIVIDEASQVPPEEAVGAIARAKQMVVVGDDKQLPPTNFFKMIDADDEDDDSDLEIPPIRAGDFESILTLARARGVAERMLRWHYRSRHPSLISVSNYVCYGGGLLLPPSPSLKADRLGLSLIKTPRGNYDRGGSGRNQVEAELVAAAIEDHILTRPDRSLGVACFSVAQRDAIEDAMQARGIVNASDAFAPKGERLFVKNLETVQGDERDVVFISIGYGPDADGRMTLGFGPLSSDGGERRLNVLISRAREQCVVFSSITSGDIPPDVRARGTRMLRQFLHFAETGHIAAGEATGSEYDSPFEEAVSAAIQRVGYNVVPQIGVSGFRVDLGVLHPKYPGRFVLGIECDGAAYHSGRSARDRERLRQEVLEGLGWKLHRIWSTDWFRNEQREADRLLNAIEQAIENADFEVDGPQLEKRVTTREPVTDLESRTSSVDAGESLSDNLAEPYRETRLTVRRGRDLLSLANHEIDFLVTAVARDEGPIHTEEVARRVREAFGLERTGRRIFDVVLAALRRLAKQGNLACEKEFWHAPGVELLKPRSRRDAVLSLKRADRIAPTEYRIAIEVMLRTSVAASWAEVKVGVARILGFDRTGADLDRAISHEIERMIASERIKDVEGRLQLI